VPAQQLLGSEMQKPKDWLFPTPEPPVSQGGFLANNLIQMIDFRFIESNAATSARTRARPLATHRARELEWRRIHADALRQYEGQWVVLENDQIVAHGDNLVQVVAEARRMGVRVPYVFRVELPNENVVLMGL